MYRARALRVASESTSRATVDAVIHEIAECQGFGLVCNHCGDAEESVVAFVTFCWEPPEHLTLCGLCYREFHNLALGEVN